MEQVIICNSCNKQVYPDTLDMWCCDDCEVLCYDGFDLHEGYFINKFIIKTINFIFNF